VLKVEKKKKNRIKILYIVFFVILFLEFLGALLGLFTGSAETNNAAASNIFLIIITAIVIIIPWRIEVSYKIDIPDILEFILLVMLFIAVVLGFLHDYYVDVQGFDKLTHTLSGVTIALLSFQTIVFLNRYEKVSLTMGPGVTSIFSFTFAMTLLVIWEFYEFLVDTIMYNINNNTGSNMQRYQWVNDSLSFPQDYGLYDTMIDLFVGAFGAFLVALVGYFIIRKQKANNSKLAE